MIKFIYLLGIVFIVDVIFTACKKKESGVCYCTYVSGDDKEFNLNHLSRSEQVDTCNLYNKNAGVFGGKCSLK